jgi:hypothetical protein
MRLDEAGLHSVTCFLVQSIGTLLATEGIALWDGWNWEKYQGFLHGHGIEAPVRAQKGVSQGVWQAGLTQVALQLVDVGPQFLDFFVQAGWATTQFEVHIWKSVQGFAHAFFH